MHSHHRARGKILFEILCALSLAVTFAAASDQVGSPALLGSAGIMALFALYWAFGLFARAGVAEVAQPIAAVAESPVAEVEIGAPPEVFACETEVVIEPEPVAVGPRKRTPRKAKKSAEIFAPMAEEPVFDGPPPEQLFDPQPFVRQPRAFGRKARGPRPVQVA